MGEGREGWRRVGPSGAREGCTVGIQARLLAHWVCKDTSGALPPHLTVPASAKRVGTLGPPRTRRHHQLLRAGGLGCPRNGTRPPPRAHFPRSLVRSLSLLLARSLGHQPPPSARSPPAAPPHSSIARAGAARPEPRRAARPPGAAALILLPGSLCLNPAAPIPVWTSLWDTAAWSLLSISLPLPGPHCMIPAARILLLGLRRTDPSGWTNHTDLSAPTPAP